MDAEKYKITTRDMQGKGVSAQSNPMELPEAEAKAIFDQLVKEVVVPRFNKVLDALEIDLGLKVNRERKTGSVTEYKVLSDNNYSNNEVQKLADAYEKRHTHGNNTVLDGISSQDLIDWRGGNVLTKNNTTPYVPTGQYHPATKDYVDKNYSETEKAKVTDAYEKRHTHNNKAVLDGIGAQDLLDWRGGNVLTKNNTIPYVPTGQYQPAMKEYVDKNYSDTEKAKVKDAYEKRHTHGNKVVLDGVSAQDLEDWRGGNVLTKDNSKAFTPTGQYQPATKEYVDKNYSETEKAKVTDAYEKRHTHGNKTVLDGVSAQDLEDWRGGNVLTKDNVTAFTPTGQYQPATKEYVDKNYSETEKAKVTDAYEKRHTHENKTVLDGITSQDLADWRGENVLTKNNAIPYVPAGPYQPATMKYVDEKVVSIGGADMTKAIYDPNNKQQDIFMYADNTRIMTDAVSGKKYILGVDGNGLYYKEVL